MGILKKKINKYNKYVIEIEDEELEANNLKSINDVIIISKEDFENELHKSKELSAKLESKDLEIKLKGLKIQEKDIQIQKAKSEMEEFKETYNSEITALENKYVTRSDELSLILSDKESELEKIKAKYTKLEKELEYKSNSLKDKLEEKETIHNQMEVYRIGNIGLKNEIDSKSKEIIDLKNNYNQMNIDYSKIKDDYSNLLDTKSQNEREIERLRSDVYKLERVQIEHNKLINNYRHLQEVANKKDKIINELESKKRKLEQYLSMSLEAITTLKNLGLFNRLFNRIPEGIDELQEDIKKLQPPKEIEIEPVRAKKTTDVLGIKEDNFEDF
jgi:hypothetical protein